MAQRKNRKSGKFTKSTRRRSKPKTNLTNIAVSALVANSITTGMFNSNLYDFATGQRDGKWVAGADGSSRLTLPELLGVGKGPIGGNFYQTSLSEVLMKNFKANWTQIAMGVILIPVAANMVTKVLAKPVIRPARKMLKSIGLKDVTL